MEKRWAIVLFVLVLVIIFCALYYFLIEFESSEISDEGLTEGTYDESNPLSSDPIYDNWYLSEVNEDADWILYDPSTAEYFNFNQTWVFEYQLNNGSLLYVNPGTEDKLVI